jgi:hypothetical protein
MNPADPSRDVITLTFARIDPRALGIACGIVAAAILFIATVVLLIRGGDPVGPKLSLLRQYFPGYSVSWPGALIGMIYGFAAGFISGPAPPSSAISAGFYLFVMRRKLENSGAELP